MAHRPNFNMKDYGKIWSGIKDIVKKSDLAFANIEAPVAESLPYSAYPDFNMHEEYPEACMEAGFNVFSLVNNHTNDQGLDGILSTKKWAETLAIKKSADGNGVYFSGLRDEGESFSHELIEKNGWKILFVATTEILNRPTCREFMNFYPYTKKGRDFFTEYVKNLREENPCDIFVVSIHTDEEEYVVPVGDLRKKYYSELLCAGADIIWANHPHVIREREIIGEKDSGVLSKIIMYGNGNTISAQRWNPAFDSPGNPRERTGDGLLFEANFVKRYTDEGVADVFIEKTTPRYITTYITPEWDFVVMPLDATFIESLADGGNMKWASYLEERKNICEKTKETITWR